MEMSLRDKEQEEKFVEKVTSRLTHFLCIFPGSSLAHGRFHRWSGFRTNDRFLTVY